MHFRKERFVFKKLIIGANPNGFGGALQRLWEAQEKNSVITTRRKPTDANEVSFEVKIPKTNASVASVISAAEDLQTDIDALEEKPTIIINAVAGGGGAPVDKNIPFHNEPEAAAASEYVNNTTLICASVPEVVARANSAIPNVAISYEPLIPTKFDQNGKAIGYTNIAVTYPPGIAKKAQEDLAAGTINTTVKPEEIKKLSAVREAASDFSNRILDQIESDEGVDNLYSIKVMFEAETDSTGIFPEMGILSCTRFFGENYATVKANPGEYPEWEKIVDFFETIPHFEAIKTKLMDLFGDPAFVGWLKDEATYGELSGDLSARLKELGLTQYIGYIRLMNSVVSDAYKTVLPHAIDKRVKEIETGTAPKVSEIHTKDLLEFKDVDLSDCTPEELKGEKSDIMSVPFFTKVSPNTYQVPLESVVLDGHFAISPGVFLKELVEKRFGRNFNESVFRGALKPLDVVEIKSNKAKNAASVFCNGQLVAEFSKKAGKESNPDPLKVFDPKGIQLKGAAERLPHSHPIHLAKDIQARVAQLVFFHGTITAKNIQGVTDYETVPFNLLLEQGMQAAGGMLMDHFDKNNIVVTNAKLTEEHRQLQVKPGDELLIEFRGNIKTNSGMYNPEVALKRASDGAVIFAGKIGCALG